MRSDQLGFAGWTLFNLFTDILSLFEPDGLSHAGAQSYDALPPKTVQSKINRIALGLCQNATFQNGHLTMLKALDEQRKMEHSKIC